MRKRGGGWPVGSGQRRGVESEAGGWTVRQKGVESEIEGGRRVGRGRMESEAEGWGRRGWIVRHGPGGVESKARGWRVRQWVESEAEGGGE